MNREDLKRKLDVDNNGKVNADDVLAFINANARNKMIAVGIACLMIGVLIGKFAL